MADLHTSSGSDPTPGTPLDWVRRNAHVVRSIDVHDREFGDLEPLRRAIGDARVVMLGEQSHGDGATFLAKARLIAFLHQEMGFDVLVWESGMYDVDRVWQAILAGEDVVTTSPRGIYGVWSRSEQVRPTLEYVASTLRTPRPLEMAGCDFQLGPHPASDSLDVQLARFAAETGSPAVHDRRWPAVAAALRHLASGDRKSRPPPPAQVATLRILTTLHDEAVAAGGRTATWWAAVLRSTRALAWSIWEDPGPGDAAVMRENEMARNLAWLAREHYHGRRVIVWAASAHISRNRDGLRAPDGTPIQRFTAVRPAGEQVHQALGAGEVYTLGFTAARGVCGRSRDTWTLPAPAEGSLEAHLERLGMEYAFLDLRRPGPGGEWLADSMMRPFGYAWFRGDWTRVLDGMFYTREMAANEMRSTQGPGSG